ncbi:MAG: hypothetical protein A2161_21450 [Candidatus Schekmanbacteria bacterium RBG_13_48_7]|uniref:HEPN domain-containing protein n=1 Tax=Candidatus Schekmanbacteria bacterium RBG_13_48_7 TaxID=1817878 RepID=A0A1F7S4D0_9BACT|nr:MAG: hypothetical protein A2161_21450 [Candidatus Schekmanbacteria bacterium RBG_13_48_7]
MYEEVRIEDTKAWFRRACIDQRAAKHDLIADPPLLEDAAFHCQQAAEKIMKTFLCWHDHPFRKTHSLEELGEQCLGIDPDLKRHVDPVVPITEYAWKFRYPGELEELTTENIKDFLEIVQHLFEAVLKRIPEEVQA